MMQLVHVLTPSILLALDGGLNIVGFWRAKRNAKPHPVVTRVFDLYSTPNGKPRFVNGGFETDGLGCMRLLWALLDSYALAGTEMVHQRFSALFADNPDEALRAGLRIYSGTDATASGEPAYFSAAQWEHHPIEMAAIKSLGKFARDGAVPR